MHLYEGDARRAVALLENAWALTRQLGDPSLESDVVGNLGLAAAAAGQRERGLVLLGRALALARAAGDRLAEKAALDRLGLTYSRQRDPARALTYFGQALAIAREVGDWQHEADLLWYVAIQLATLGQRDDAIARAQAAVDLLARRGKPQATWFAHHLHAYRTAGTGARLGGAEASGATPPAAPADGPRLLDMAFSAARSMAQFLGSGWKTTPPEARQQRQQTCAACEHHTGLRCRLCGCFTSLKAALTHEECPLGKWPA